MKIRIKVKTLVMGTAALGMLAAVLLMQPFGGKAGILSEAAKPTDKAALLARLADAKPGQEKWKLIQAYVIEPGGGTIRQQYRVFVGSSFTEAGGVDDGIERPELTWEEKLPYLNDYVKSGPVGTMDYATAAHQLATYYESMNDADEGIAVLRLAEERLTDEQRSQRNRLMLAQAKLLAEQGDDEAARTLLDQITANNRSPVDLNLPTEIAALKARMLIHKQRIAEAIATVKQGITDSRRAMAELKEQTGGDKNDNANYLEEPLQQLLTVLKPLASAGKGQLSAVSGTVLRSDGQPMAHVGVFLRENNAVNHSITDDEPYQTMTDAQGRYAFADVLPGAYQLALGFRYGEIDGWSWPVANDDWIDVKSGETVTLPVTLRPLINLQAPVNNEPVAGDWIDFRWSPVEGASYYNISGTIELEKGGSIGVAVRDHIVGSELRMRTDDLYTVVSGTSFDTIDGRQEPNPVSLLGFAYPGQRHSWSVEAYNAAGEKIAQSNGYRLTPDTIGNLPFFTLDSRSLADGDRLLLHRKYEEAMTAYKEAVVANPKDVYSLSMIVKLYDTRDDGLSKEEKLGKKLEALPYAQRLMTLKPSAERAFWLMDNAIGIKDWEQADTYYSAYRRYADGVPNTYVDAIYAKALLTQGKYSQALKLLAASAEKDGSHRFVGYYLAASLLTGESIVKTEQLAERYPERNVGGQTRDWGAIVQAMGREAAGHPDYADLLRQALAWQLNDQAADLEKWKLETPLAMKNFLQTLALVY